MALKDFSVKWLSGLLFCLLLISIIFWNYESILNYSILILSKDKWAAETLFVVSAIVGLLKKLRWSEIKLFNVGQTTTDGMDAFYKAFGIISKPGILSCSYSILRGLFLQTFADDCFFPNFDKFEIVFLWGISFLIMRDAVYDFYIQFKALTVLESVETPQVSNAQSVKQPKKRTVKS